MYVKVGAKARARKQRTSQKYEISEKQLKNSRALHSRLRTLHCRGRLALPLKEGRKRRKRAWLGAHHRAWLRFLATAPTDEASARTRPDKEGTCFRDLREERPRFVSSTDAESSRGWNKSQSPQVLTSEVWCTFV